MVLTGVNRPAIEPKTSPDPVAATSGPARGKLLASNLKVDESGVFTSILELELSAVTSRPSPFAAGTQTYLTCLDQHGRQRLQHFYRGVADIARKTQG